MTTMRAAWEWGAQGGRGKGRAAGRAHACHSQFWGPAAGADAVGGPSHGALAVNVRKHLSAALQNAPAVVIPCADQAEVDHYWDLLTADGGEESQCGWLKDKFGISWQVTSKEMEKYLGGPDAAGAARATQAMLEMRKIDLAAMKAAYLAN